MPPKPRCFALLPFSSHGNNCEFVVATGGAGKMLLKSRAVSFLIFLFVLVAANCQPDTEPAPQEADTLAGPGIHEIPPRSERAVSWANELLEASFVYEDGECYAMIDSGPNEFICGELLITVADSSQAFQGLLREMGAAIGNRYGSAPGVDIILVVTKPETEQEFLRRAWDLPDVIIIDVNSIMNIKGE